MTTTELEKKTPTHAGMQEFRQQLQQQMITINSMDYLTGNLQR